MRHQDADLLERMKRRELDDQSAARALDLQISAKAPTQFTVNGCANLYRSDERCPTSEQIRAMLKNLERAGDVTKHTGPSAFWCYWKLVKR